MSWLQALAGVLVPPTAWALVWLAIPNGWGLLAGAALGIILLRLIMGPDP